MKLNSNSTRLRRRIGDVFGDATDPMSLVEQRAQALLKDKRHIVWEGDASTFEFLYVSKSAENLLGYPADRWLKEPSFWADVVIHPEDRENAIAYCALASGQRKDHDFIYRARTAYGDTVSLHDFVRIVPGRYNLAAYLRGVMIEVSAPALQQPGLLYSNPSFESLQTGQGASV